MARKKSDEPVGRPLKYKTAQALESAIQAYFDDCDNHMEEIHMEEGGVVAMNKPEPYTISGLALWLGFVAVQSIHDYEARGKFSDVIKRARLKIEAQDEKTLKKGKGGAGLIFVTKNRHGWTDKQQIEQTSDISISFEGGDV